MQFALQAEQETVRDVVRAFAEKYLQPGVAERDEAERFDRRLYDAMAELGLSGLAFARECGGEGHDTLSFILALEELAKVDDSISASLSASVFLCQWPIYHYGTPMQRERYFRPLVAGQKLGAFGLTEPQAGTDAASQQTVAVREGDSYRLNGSKIFITNGGEADIYLVFAMTDKGKGVKGISAFILEKGMPGFSFGPAARKLGLRASATCELFFDDVRVPVDQRLGAEGEGFRIAMTALDGGRIGVAAQAVGISQAALDHAVAYAQQRVQFGKPIAATQAVSFLLADMATKVEAARLLTYQAAWQRDQGAAYSQAAAMAKMFASDTAMAITTDAVQIFGGYGFMREYPVERLMRNAKITQIYEGTNQVQRMVIANALLH